MADRDSNPAWNNLEKLVDWFRHFSSCIVAFSAGVDSSILAFAARRALGDRAYAVTSHSPSFSESEKDASRKVAQEIGIQLFEVEQDDLADNNYVKNMVTRCYFCRSNLASSVFPVVQRLSAEVCVDGTNLDDMHTPRPGIRALREAGFRAPLTELKLRKVDVRAMARHAGLSTWDRPSEACLSSRIAFGQEIDLQTLQKIESAETLVRSTTGAKIVRVRTIGKNAIVEVDKPSIKQALAKEEIITRELRLLGYEGVQIDLQGYVSGRMLELFVKDND